MILKLRMTPCEWRQLTGSYSWPTKAFGLGARSRVAARTCWKHVLNKVFLDLEGELKLSEATVLDGSVASLWLKLFLSNM